MKMARYALWLLLVGFVLASCTSSPTPTVEEPTPDGLALNIVRPDIQEFAGESLLEAQAETYSITLRFVGNPPTSVRNALNAAKTRWQRVITQGVPAANLSIPANNCGSNPAFSGVVDDITIFGGVANIDGPGGILAQSGPCFIRTPSGFPIAGTLIFDSADVGAFGSQLTAIATHEIGHSLGIGTLWQYKSLLQGATTNNPTFSGTNAKREWVTLGGTGNVPVENTGGPGTRNGHWRETTFGNELMTGFLNAGTNPLSRLTIASLRDLGYVVNLGAADPYRRP
jgi:hypothetical protein